MGKKDIVDAYVAAPKPKPVTIWKRSEERELQSLKDALMPLKDTALGVATTHSMADSRENSREPKVFV